MELIKRNLPLSEETILSLEEDVKRLSKELDEAILGECFLTSGYLTLGQRLISGGSPNEPITRREVAMLIVEVLNEVSDKLDELKNKSNES